MNRNTPAQIIPPSVVNGFLDKAMKLDDIRKDIEALQVDLPEISYNEKQVREWLEIPASATERVYTAEEKAGIIDMAFPQVYAKVTHGILARLSEATPEMAITFGSPGTGKTTLACQLSGYEAVMIDANEVQKEVNLYKTAMDDYGGDSVLGAVTAYAYGRWGANYVANRLINAVLPNYDIVYGTTATSDAALNLYDNAAAAGVHMPMYMVAAPEDVRTASCKERAWGARGDRLPIPQSHVIEKNLLFPPMIRKHFAKALEAEIYWRPALHADAEHIGSARSGRVEIFNEAAQKAMIAEITHYKPNFSWQKDVVAPHAQRHSR